MPVVPGTVVSVLSEVFGVDTFLRIFCGSKVFELNSWGLIKLSDTVTAESTDTNFELRMSFLLFANFTVDEFTLFTK